MKAIKLSGAVRRLIGPRGDGCNEIRDLDRELRDAAAECQRVLELVEADANRPPVTGFSGRRNSLAKGEGLN